jgi:hypothetical protein
MVQIMPNLYDEVLANSHYRETKADVVAYYQEKYTGYGQQGWKQHIIHDLLGQQDITQNSVGKVEYARLAKNMARRFDPSRLDRPEPRNADEYRALGETLPPIPDGRFHITGIIWFKYMDEPCESREVDEVLTYEQSQELAGMAYQEMLQAVTNHYMSNDGTGGDIHEDEPMLVSSQECADSDLTIEVIE